MYGIQGQIGFNEKFSWRILRGIFVAIFNGYVTNYHRVRGIMVINQWILECCTLFFDMAHMKNIQASIFLGGLSSQNGPKEAIVLILPSPFPIAVPTFARFRT